MKRYLTSLTVFILVCCSVFCDGCKRNNYTTARRSRDWMRDAIIYGVNLRSFSSAGTFKCLEMEIPDLKSLGINVISLVSVFSIGELNRQGTYGNPYAVKDFYEINPEFGNKEDFKSLVNSAHRQGLKIVIEIAADIAAWDSRLLMEHPDWFVHNAEGAIVSPTLICPMSPSWIWFIMKPVNT